jgi:hypothetical protein
VAGGGPAAGRTRFAGPEVEPAGTGIRARRRRAAHPAHERVMRVGEAHAPPSTLSGRCGCQSRTRWGGGAPGRQAHDAGVPDEGPGMTRAHWENATRGDPSVLRWPYAMSIERPCMWDVMLVASVWSQAGEEHATQRGGGNAMQHDTGGGCHASSAPSTLWRAPQSVYDEATSSPLMSERRRKRVRK